MNARKSTGNSSSCDADHWEVAYFKLPRSVLNIVRLCHETHLDSARTAQFSRPPFHPHFHSTGADKQEIFIRQIRAVTRCVVVLIMKFRICKEIDCLIGPGVDHRVKCSRICSKPTIPCATRATMLQVRTLNMDLRAI